MDENGKVLDLSEFTNKSTKQTSYDRLDVFSNISLAGFLQLLEMEGKTCVLEVSIKDDANEKGAFFFKNGSLYHAIYKNLTGEEAAITMISYGPNAVCNCLKKLPNQDISKNINEPLMGLLLEGMKRRDDAQRKQNQIIKEVNQNTSTEEFDFNEEELSFFDEVENNEEENQNIYSNQQSNVLSQDINNDISSTNTTNNTNYFSNSNNVDQNIIENLKSIQIFLQNNIPGFLVCGIINLKTELSILSISKNSNLDLSVFAESYSKIVKSAFKAFEFAGWKTPKEFLIPGDSHNVFLIPLAEVLYCQTITVSNTTSLGLVRAIFNKVKNKIEAELPL